MKKDESKRAQSSVQNRDSEEFQWFPDNPAKPVTKWSFLIALLDEIAILVIVVIIIYVLINRL